MKRNHIYVYILLSIAIAYLIYVYLFSPTRYPMMMYHHYGYYNSFSSGLYYSQLILTLLAYVSIVLCGIYLFRSKERRNDAIEILNRRLSNGDISVEEYQELLRVLYENKDRR